MSPPRAGRCDACGGKIAPRSRGLEDLGFVVGIGLAVLYTMGVKVGPANPPAWAVVVLVATLIAPKMIGRASAGRIWNVIAARFGGATHG